MLILIASFALFAAINSTHAEGMVCYIRCNKQIKLNAWLVLFAAINITYTEGRRDLRYSLLLQCISAHTEEMT